MMPVMPPSPCVPLVVACVPQEKAARESLAEADEKCSAEIRSDAGFSSVKIAKNCNFAWSKAWEKYSAGVSLRK